MRFLLLLMTLFPLTALALPNAEPWQSAYVGNDTSASHVIAFWNFDGDGDTATDTSGNGNDGVFAGASRGTEGRFGAGMESLPGWPVEDVQHAVRVPDSDALSPRGAFTAEMWLRPANSLEGYPEAFLLDKKYVAHDDFQWILGAPDQSGNRQMRVVMGFGEDSDTWYSTDAVAYEPNTWYHVAFTYDAAGTVEFLRDGRTLGKSTRSGRGPVHPGAHGLSIGDRIGSLYHGFPGSIDEVRLCTGVREFRPIVVNAAHLRTAYRRMEPGVSLKFDLINARRDPISDIKASIRVPGMPDQTREIAEIAAGAIEQLTLALDTALRPGSYAVELAYQFGTGDSAYDNRETFPLTIVPRQPPHRMPVVMWGIGGVDEVLDNLPLLKEIGFTHCLGLRCDFDAIWTAGAPAPAQDERNLAASYRMLDRAFAEDLGVIISLGVGHWLDAKTDLLRVGPDGKPYERVNPCCLTPGLLEFSKNVGLSVAQSYGAFPAFQAALINTEVRDSSQICFHPHDQAACQAATGHEIPPLALSKNGVNYADIPGFPLDRVLPDDNSLLQFYRWFWKEGDGWNAMHSAVHDGLQDMGREDFWTFFDPAVRVPAIWGSGGNVDFLSHWTYSYPDPERIGLAADELIAMAAGGPAGQDVMKMTQIIWYRSQTAPPEEKNDRKAQSAWEDYDPDAAYITIAPAHLREAFWCKIARPVKGIMYHGWQSLVPTDSSTAYRYTHPETQYALKDLLDTVVKPLGPALLQIPATPNDAAFMKSFSSEMFAGRGTYGWGGSWAADAFHILRYAGIQPDIVFEETILQKGLDAYRLLVLADCDVLPKGVVDKILGFQQRGGIIVGDERLCPAITPDLRLDVYTRTGTADEDKAALVAQAALVRSQLAPAYAPAVSSSNPDVLVYRRQYGSADYIFAINDTREFGAYVGSHRKVMENGLPAATTLTLPPTRIWVYDLVESRSVNTVEDNTLNLDLEPGGGRLLLALPQAIATITATGPQEANPGDSIRLAFTITGSDGAPLDAVIPVSLEIRDPDGRPAEYSGHYGALGGQLDITLKLAPNDTPGLWSVRAREGASGMIAWHYFRLHTASGIAVGGDTT